MNPPVFPTTDADARRVKDVEHLRLLAIFHFVGAGLSLLGIGFLFLHYLFLHAFFGNPAMWKDAKNAPPFPPDFFKIFIWFYIFGGAVLVTFAIINVLSGIFLHRQRHRMFSLVVAGLNCIHMPLGTVLGVFTLVALQRDSVRALYPTSRSIAPAADNR